MKTENLKKLTVREVYESIYRKDYFSNLSKGFSADKSSRKANLKAIKETWFVYNVIQGYIK